MARKRAPEPVPDDLGGDPAWYIREWAQYRGFTQAELARRAGWAKASAHAIWTGKTGYYEQLVSEAARVLDAAPYELLLPPAQAMAIRDLYDSAKRIAASPATPYRAPPRATPRTKGEGEKDGPA